MKNTQVYSMQNSEIDVISENISNFLTENGCDRLEAKKYCLIAEDSMLKWRTSFGNDHEIKVSLNKGRLSFGFTLEVIGNKYDPLAKDEDEEYSINQKLVSKIDNDISYKYRRGRNIVNAVLCKTDRAYIWRSILILMLPIIIQNLLTNIVSASDALMLGVLNQESLAAVSQVSQITNIYTCLITGLIGGTTVFASQFWGRRDKDSVEKILAITLQISTFIGVLFWFFTFLFPGLLMNILTNDSTIHSLGCDYLRITSWTYIIMAFTQVYLVLMKSVGKSGTSSLYAAIVMVINIALNYLLIYGVFGIPALGIKGAAYATVISRTIELALVIFENFRKENVKFKFIYFIKLKQELRKDFMKVTLPSILSVFEWGMFQFVAAAVIGHLGADATAANSFANIIKNIALCFCNGVISGTGIIIGYQLGKNKFEHAKAYSKKILRILFVAGCIVGLILFGLTEILVNSQKTFTDDARFYLRVLLIIYSAYIPIKSVCGAIAAGVINAGGLAKICLKVDIIVTWCILCPILLLASLVFNAPVIVVFVIFIMDDVLKLPIFYYYYKKEKWLRNITVS